MAKKIVDKRSKDPVDCKKKFMRMADQAIDNLFKLRKKHCDKCDVFKAYDLITKSDPFQNKANKQAHLFTEFISAFLLRCFERTELHPADLLQTIMLTVSEYVDFPQAKTPGPDQHV